MSESQDWADAMADGETYDESITPEPRHDANDDMNDPDAVPDEYAPEGAEERDEEWADDDPADVPDEHGGTQAGIDTDDNGIDDTLLPEGTDSIVEEDVDVDDED